MSAQSLPTTVSIPATPFMPTTISTSTLPTISMIRASTTEGDKFNNTIYNIQTLQSKKPLIFKLQHNPNVPHNFRKALAPQFDSVEAAQLYSNTRICRIHPPNLVTI
eukprot:TRINITY_DN384_c0_g2_i2.p2 TRINITY_DN384_c0_g2~~TRINITY_DN384_c0_g2_i2.p2  ORF type:complete len:107 (-),score=19.55 TRINITY_DN384_c0_g2_i2:791-1111(-)